MRKLITGALGVLCGIAIIIMAFAIKATPAKFDEESFDKLSAVSADPADIEDILTCNLESDKYYGGDAYSGMQQAAAQAANNVMALEETLLQTNESVLAVNENLKDLNKNLVKANNNAVAAAQMQDQNMIAACQSITETAVQIAFFVLLAMGLIMLICNVNPVLDGLETVLAKKKAEEIPAE